ncbi:MAG: inositol monophosphatase family protein [Bacteroidota bacterium]
MKLATEDLLALRNFACKAASTAAHHIQQNVGKISAVRHKKGMQSKASAVVTEIDLQCQELILDVLKDTFQEYDLGLLTEELTDDGSRLIKDYFWCIDPLDGTLAFTENRPGYAVSIALVSKDGEPVIGVVHDPVNDELYSGINGAGSNMPDRFEEEKQMLSCYFDNSIKYHPHKHIIVRELRQLVEKLGLDDLQIHYGKGAVLNASYVARSQNGVYLKFPKREQGGGCIWDFAATACLFEETGLIVSDISGGKLPFNDHQSLYFNQCGVIYASNTIIQKAIIDLFHLLKDM